jgi:hypothetical protein
MEIAWLEVADSPEVWRRIGFDVDSLGRCFVGGIEHRLIGEQPSSRGLVRWAVSGIDPDISSIDGLATKVVDAVESLSSGSHRNRISRIDHLVVRTSDTPRTTQALENVGLQRRGASDSTSSGEAVDMTFFWVGDTLLELVGPPTPLAEPKPARFMGIAYASDDLDATAEILGELCSVPKDAVQRGRRIAALRASAGSSVPMAFMTPHV